MINLNQIQKKYNISAYQLNKLIKLNNITPVFEKDIENVDMIGLTKYNITIKYFDEEVIDEIINKK